MAVISREGVTNILLWSDPYEPVDDSYPPDHNRDSWLHLKDTNGVTIISKQVTEADLQGGRIVFGNMPTCRVAYIHIVGDKSQHVIPMVPSRHVLAGDTLQVELSHSVT